MIWTHEMKDRLAREWRDRGVEDPRAFDQRLAQEWTCTARAVQCKRSALGLTERTVEREAAPAPPAAPAALEDAVVEALEAERKRLQQAAFRKDLKKAVHQTLRAEYAGEAFLQGVRRLPAPRPVVLEPRGERTGEEEIVAVISDCQIGSKGPPDYLRGVARFSLEIFRERLRKYVHAVGRLIAERGLVTEVPQLRVFLLGDIIDGHGIYPGQGYELEQTIIDQILVGVQDLSAAISAWSSIVPRISVHCVPGNHGRVAHEAAARDNWEFLLYKMMALQLQNHRSVAFDIQRSPFQVVDVQGWRFLLTHGQENRGRVPVAAAVRNEAEYRGLFHGAGQEPCDYYVFGDRHTQMAGYQTSGGEILMNGCWPGGSTYSVGRLVIASRPSQLVFGVTEAEGVTWRRAVDLDRFPA